MQICRRPASAGAADMTETGCDPAHYINSLCALLEFNKRCVYSMRDEPLPGEQLGCDLEQHEKALKNAQPAEPGPLRPACQTRDVTTLVEEVDKLVHGTKGRSDQNTIKSLLAMNIFLEQQLASSPPLLSRHLADVLQRKLASSLPTTTKLASHSVEGQPKLEASTYQNQIQQLKVRCAVAKGRHRLQYSGHPAASQLLSLLAEQNNPSIKAVLRLPVDPHSDWKVSTSQKDCRGEFELNLDVRGTYIAPIDVRGTYMAPVHVRKEPTHVPEVQEADIFQLVGEAEVFIRRHWDTYVFSVPTEGTAAALALEVCHMVMQNLQRDGRGACIIVRRHPNSLNRKLVALAELDYVNHKGTALLNSPGVCRKMLEDPAEDRQPPLAMLERQLNAYHASTAAIFASLAPDRKDGRAMAEATMNMLQSKGIHSFGLRPMWKHEANE